MNIDSSDKVTVYDFHSGKKPFSRLKPKFFWVVGLLLFLPFPFVVFLFETTHGLLKVLAGCYGVLWTILSIGYFAVIVMVLSTSTITVNISKKNIKRERYFLNRRAGWSKIFLFSDFKAVVIDQKIGRKQKGCYVGLKLLTGKTFWVQPFANVPGESSNLQAEEMANQLSRNLGLPINKIE